MTVKELINELKSYPAEAVVLFYHEGAWLDVLDTQLKGKYVELLEEEREDYGRAE